jgi:hypothetical protein
MQAPAATMGRLVDLATLPAAYREAARKLSDSIRFAYGPALEVTKQ